MLPYNDFAANGNNPLNSVSQPKGALQRGSSLWEDRERKPAEFLRLPSISRARLARQAFAIMR